MRFHLQSTTYQLQLVVPGGIGPIVEIGFSPGELEQMVTGSFSIDGKSRGLSHVCSIEQPTMKSVQTCCLRQRATACDASNINRSEMTNFIPVYRQAACQTLGYVTLSFYSCKYKADEP